MAEISLFAHTLSAEHLPPLIEITESQYIVTFNTQNVNGILYKILPISHNIFDLKIFPEKTQRTISINGGKKNMRTYYTVGTTELTSFHSHMMISSHGLHDRITTMDPSQRERYLSGISHIALGRGCSANTDSLHIGLDTFGPHL